MSASKVVAPDLAQALSVLRKSTSELNQLTDRGSELVRMVEAELERQSIGITAQVLVKEYEDDFTAMLLGYVYANDKLRVSLLWAERGDDSPLIRPWAECSRDEKLASLEFLPALLLKLADQVEQRISPARSAVEQSEVALALRQPSGRE
jgi:hypothetical protein